MGTLRPRFSVLVANRGEIALRVMRTARSMGFRTIAVYADADVNAPHVRFADSAFRIGKSPVGESYLRVEAILDAARSTGADAVHPGYGLLSENAAFARAVTSAGLIFVGPPADAVEIMGDKATAKRRMIEVGVPCVPGYSGTDQSSSRLAAEAVALGFPVMVKAAAGGGGRGMRRVEHVGALADAVALARAEAESAFGSGALIVEKAISRPRHVEIQVFADGHGNTIHLGERDCSVQRRHQKIIEEAPCPVLTPELRERMGAAAVAAAEAVGYQGAGTVEFLLDDARNFYFLEMNTRLQVEHPVTECVTGLDLVELQLRVARGEPLPVKQQDVRMEGAAIEVRLYAEDPAQDFLPSTGRVELWRAPEGPGVRVDAGITTGSVVTPFYDAMVAKIIAHGRDRDEARRRLVRGLQDTALFGVAHNRDFLVRALEHSVFVEGGATTAFLDQFFGNVSPTVPTAPELALAAVVLRRLRRQEGVQRSTGVHPELLDWSSTGRLESIHVFEGRDGPLEVWLSARDDDSFTARLGDDEIDLSILDADGTKWKLTCDGEVHRLTAFLEGSRLWVSVGPRSFVLDELSGAADDAEGAGGGRVQATMHGRLTELFVESGALVAKGDRLGVLEAMKMHFEIVAPVGGKVIGVHAARGDQVAAEDLLIEIEPRTGP